MQGKVKLTKREIKEDKFATFMLSAKDRMEDSWQFFAIGAAAVVLAIAAVIFFVSQQRSGTSESAQKFAQAQMEYRSGNTQVAVMSLNSIVDEYGGQTAQDALFLLGRINFETRNFPEAIRYWEQYINKYKEDKLNLAGAIGGIAASYENQGQYPEAAAKFMEAIDAYPEGPAVGDFRMGAMRSYLAAGRLAEAREQLTKIEADFANTELAQRAARLYAEKDPTASGA